VLPLFAPVLQLVLDSNLFMKSFGAFNGDFTLLGFRGIFFGNNFFDRTWQRDDWFLLAPFECPGKTLKQRPAKYEKR
jgi:hypothetical protein